jgi:hypothetical protein
MTKQYQQREDNHTIMPPKITQEQSNINKEK